MTRVKAPRPKPLPEGVEPHVLALVGRLLEVTREALLARDADGLRPSHLRLLSHVPPSGITITDLAATIAMTKQGVGQFVTQLQGSGHLRVSADPADRRRRVVRRTSRGDARVAHANQTVAAAEEHWKQQVGPERYAVFRSVLSEIAVGRAEAGPQAGGP